MINDEKKLKRQRNCLQIYEFLKETLLRSTTRSLKARFLGAVRELAHRDLKELERFLTPADCRRIIIVKEKEVQD